MKKFIGGLFFVLVCLSVTAALWVFKDLLFPFVTSKAFFFRICIELAFPLYLYLIVADPKLRPNMKNPMTLTLLAFLAVNIISSFAGVNVVRSLWGNFERMGGAFYLANLVALYFYILALGEMKGPYLDWFLKFLFFVAFIITGNGIFGWLHLPTLVLDPSLPGRVSSTLGNPIYLGSYLIIPLYMSVFFALQAAGALKKLGYYFLAFLFLTGIFLSGTRGAVVGVLLGSFLSAVAYLVFVKSRKVKTYGFAAVAVLVGISAVLFLNSAKLPQGSTLQRIFRLDDSNTKARLIQWQIALKGYKDRPILGTGPENYYIIANKYYNPKIFQYDPSWFDKPHNYLLEILVTDGIFGFLAYVVLLALMALALYKGYKGKFYGLAEFSVLLAALLAYQIQNFTVFDTVPASLMFYSFLGFLGYIWVSSEDQNLKTKSRSAGYGGALPLAVLAVSFIVAAYVIYATNIAPAIAAKDVNYGYAYGQVDGSKGLAYFNAAASSAFNFDPTQTASKFAAFAQTFIQQPSASAALSAQILTAATSYLENVVSQQPNDPTLWQSLSSLYLFNSTASGNHWTLDPRAQDALNKSWALAPQREENYIAQAQIYTLEGNLSQAQSILEQDIKIFPTDTNARVELVSVYRLQGNLAGAVSLMEQALNMGYSPDSVSRIAWLIDYYSQTKQWDKAIALQQLADNLDGNNIQEFVTLANLYAGAGQDSKALNLAQNIAKADPTQAKAMQALIISLSAESTSTPAAGK